MNESSFTCKIGYQLKGSEIYFQTFSYVIKGASDFGKLENDKRIIFDSIISSLDKSIQGQPRTITSFLVKNEQGGVLLDEYY